MIKIGVEYVRALDSDEFFLCDWRTKKRLMSIVDSLDVVIVVHIIISSGIPSEENRQKREASE
jgi:hypothetical protein